MPIFLLGNLPQDKPKNELLRVVSYVCMTPKSLASETVLRARRQAFRNGVTTGHWPHLMPFSGYAGKDSDPCEFLDEESPQEMPELVG